MTPGEVARIVDRREEPEFIALLRSADREFEDETFEAALAACLRADADLMARWNLWSCDQRWTPSAAVDGPDDSVDPAVGQTTTCAHSSGRGHCRRRLHSSNGRLAYGCLSQARVVEDASDVSLKEEAKARARESFGDGDFAGALADLRFWCDHDPNTEPSYAGRLFHGLIRDAIRTGSDPDLTKAAIEWARLSRLIGGVEARMLRAGHRIMAGETDAALASVEGLVRGPGLGQAALLSELAAYLDAAGQTDLAREYRCRSEVAECEASRPAQAVLEGGFAPLPSARVDRLVREIQFYGVFALPYVPWWAFDQRTADGAEDVAAFDAACWEIEQELLLVRHNPLQLAVVPADPASLRRLAARRGWDPHDPWTAVRWAVRQARDGHGSTWPPDPYDPCWCGRPLLYDDCCRDRCLH